MFMLLQIKGMMMITETHHTAFRVLVQAGDFAVLDAVSLLWT